MHQKHGAYYLVKDNKWIKLSRDYQKAFTEYARLTQGPGNAALGDLVTKTLADLKADGIAASTMKSYKIQATRILKVFANFTPAQIKPHHVAQFLDSMKAKPSAANHAHAFMRNMFKRAVRWGLIEADPSRDIDQFKTKARDRYITAQEYAAIRAAAKPAMQALMDLSYITGQRIMDCALIRYADITDEGVFFRQQKTGVRMLVAMTPDLQEAINQAKAIHQSVKGLTLLHRRDGTPIPYHTLYSQWRAACQRAGVEGANFHDIRAAAATDAKGAGLDSKTLLGHTTESAHMRYLRSKETPVATPNRGRKAV